MTDDQNQAFTRMLNKILDPKTVGDCHFFVESQILLNDFNPATKPPDEVIERELLKKMVNAVVEKFSKEVKTETDELGNKTLSMELFVMLPQELKSVVNGMIMLLSDDQIACIKEGHLFTELGIDFDNSTVNDDNVIEKLEELIAKSKNRLKELKQKPLTFAEKVEQIKAKIKYCERGFSKCGDKGDWGGCEYWQNDKEEAIKELDELFDDKNLEILAENVAVNSHEFYEQICERAADNWQDIKKDYELEPHKLIDDKTAQDIAEAIEIDLRGEADYLFDLENEK